VALCTAEGLQQAPKIVADGAGGAIVTWEDYRGWPNPLDIYAQRVNPAGVPQWTFDGVVVCAAADYQSRPTIVADGAGGAIVTWQDYRSGANFDIYAQRLNAEGAPQWSSDGVAVCTAVNDQESPTIVSDGADGAIAAWQDSRGGSHDIYGQRLNAAGVPQWTPDGVAVCTAANSQESPAITPDGAGGAIFAWRDLRPGTSYDIYSQRVNAAGAPQWTLDGVAVCDAVSNQESPTIVTAGGGGAIVAWQDLRNTTNLDIYADWITPNGNLLAILPTFGDFGSSIAISGRDFDAQTTVRFNGTLASATIHSSSSLTATVPQGATVGPIEVSGACGTQTTLDYFYPPGWPFCGVPVSRTSSQESQVEVSDGSGGVIIVWREARGASLYDLYAQRMNANGQPLWPQTGVPLCSAAGDQLYPAIVSDGASGAIVTWQDRRGGSNDDIYAQRVNAAGTPLWTADGVALCTATNKQEFPAIASDGAGGAIVTWQDSRSVLSLQKINICTQRVSAAGVTQWTSNGVVLTGFRDQTSPTIVADMAGGAIITWTDIEIVIDEVIVSIVAQRVNAAGAPQWPGGVAVSPGGVQSAPTMVSDGSGGAIVAWTDSRGDGGDIYAQRVSAAGAAQWTAGGVALCNATGAQSGPKIAPDGAGGAVVTWEDSRSGTHSDIYAQRVNGSGATQWTLNGVALRIGAVNQHAPAIMTDGAGGAIVTWQVDGGEIYSQRLNGAGASQWTAGGVLLCDHGGADARPVIALDAAGGAIITFRATSGGIDAVRVRSNGLVTGVEPIASVFAPPLAWPNPFREQVSIAFSLPARALVRMEVFDVAGRRVWASPIRRLESGRHTLIWNGRTDAGTAARGGIYFLRVRGPGVAVSRSVVRAN
jgi:hypothetical protein